MYTLHDAHDDENGDGNTLDTNDNTICIRDVRDDRSFECNNFLLSTYELIIMARVSSTRIKDSRRVACNQKLTTCWPERS